VEPQALEFQLTDAELGAGARQAFLDTKRLPIAFGAGLLSAIACFFVPHLWPLGVFLLLFFGLMAYRLLYPAPLGRRMMRLNPFLGEMRTWTFDERGIKVKGATQSSEWQWRSIESLHNRGGAHYLRVRGSSQRIVIPSRAFTSVDAEERFESFVHEQIAAATLALGESGVREP
jgi:hypothetical protein